MASLVPNAPSRISGGGGGVSSQGREVRRKRGRGGSKVAWWEVVEAGEGDADSKDGGLGSGRKFGRDIEILLRRVYSDEIREAVDSGIKVLMSSVRRGMAEVNSLFHNLTAQQVRDKLFTISSPIKRRSIGEGKGKGKRKKSKKE